MEWDGVVRLVEDTEKRWVENCDQEACLIELLSGGFSLFGYRD
jgi:hypothetical protein